MKTETVAAILGVGTIGGILFWNMRRKEPMETESAGTITPNPNVSQVPATMADGNNYQTPFYLRYNWPISRGGQSASPSLFNAVSPASYMTPAEMPPTL